jgi:hypothetical protein
MLLDRYDACLALAIELGGASRIKIIGAANKEAAVA